MITRNIITAEQREQLKKLADDLYKKNVEMKGEGDNYLNMLNGAYQLIASAYSFYGEDEQ